MITVLEYQKICNFHPPPIFSTINMNTSPSQFFTSYPIIFINVYFSFVQERTSIIYSLANSMGSNSVRNAACVLGLLGVLLLLLFVTLICEARVLSVTDTLSSSPPGFVQSKGTEFELNGSPFLFNGFNSYWMMNVAVDSNQRYKVSDVFRDASAAGLRVCRTWAFSDGGDQALQVSPGV